MLAISAGILKPSKDLRTIIKRVLGPYSPRFIFFLTYEWDNGAGVSDMGVLDLEASGQEAFYNKVLG
jgi:hypothetical protein